MIWLINVISNHISYWERYSIEVNMVEIKDYKIKNCINNSVIKIYKIFHNRTFIKYWNRNRYVINKNLKLHKIYNNKKRLLSQIVVLTII